MKKSRTCCSLLKASSAPSRFLSWICSTKLKFPPRMFVFFLAKAVLSLSSSSSSILLLFPFLPKLKPWKFTTLKFIFFSLQVRLTLMILPGSSESYLSLFPLTVYEENVFISQPFPDQILPDLSSILPLQQSGHIPELETPQSCSPLNIIKL